MSAQYGSAPDVVRPFYRQVSRDLEQIAEATNHFRQAWRALTPLGSRHAFAGTIVLEIALMMGTLAAERRRLEDEQGL